VVAVAAAATAVVLGLAGRKSGTPDARATAPASSQPATKRSRSQSRRPALDKRAAAAVARFARRGLPVYCGGYRGRSVALTFDDGPGKATGGVVRLLRRAGARATFFVLGQNVGAYAGTLRAERSLGTIGNHSWSQPRLTALSPGGISSEIEATQRAIRRATGRSPLLFHPPYGAHDATVDAAVRSVGLLQVLWSIDSYDSRGFTRRQVTHTVLKLVQPGSIILLHENLPATVKALPKILRVLKHRRFRLVTVPELLALDPPSTAQVQKGLPGCYGRAASTR